MAWTSEDLSWLKSEYPTLKVGKNGDLAGALRFRMLHADGTNYIKPNGAMITAWRSTGTYIVDNYAVRISWEEPELTPSAYETAGRIEKVATAKGKKMLDMHVHSSGALCLADTTELYRAFAAGCSLRRYIEEFLIPYLFAQTHYEATDNWLWGELSHDFWGHLEWLGRLKQPQPIDIKATSYLVTSRIGADKAVVLFSTRCRGHKPCPCGSGRKNNDCHPDIKAAIALIRGQQSRQSMRR